MDKDVDIQIEWLLTKFKNYRSSEENAIKENKKNIQGFVQDFWKDPKKNFRILKKKHSIPEGITLRDMLIFLNDENFKVILKDYYVLGKIKKDIAIEHNMPISKLYKILPDSFIRLKDNYCPYCLSDRFKIERYSEGKISIICDKYRCKGRFNINNEPINKEERDKLFDALEKKNKEIEEKNKEIEERNRKILKALKAFAGEVARKINMKITKVYFKYYWEYHDELYRIGTYFKKYYLDQDYKYEMAPNLYGLTFEHVQFKGNRYCKKCGCSKFLLINFGPHSGGWGFNCVGCIKKMKRDTLIDKPKAKGSILEDNLKKIEDSSIESTDKLL